MQANMAKVSIIVPCYNREEYIGECVDSLIHQTYPRERMELIFVDDGSTDMTVDILREYETRYPDEIIVVCLSENSGGRPGYVRNVGMQYMSGDYVMFVDSDDVVDDRIVERMYTLAVDGDTEIVSANMQMFYGDDVLLTETKDDRIFDTSIGQDFIDLLSSEGSDGHIGARLYATDFLRENNIFFPEGHHVGEDTYFNMRCLLALHRFGRTSEVLYYYRNNADGLWRSDRQPPEQILDCFRTQEELLPFYQTRLADVYEVVEWFFFQSLILARMRLFDMGQEDFYYSELPSIRERCLTCVPNLSANSIICTHPEGAAKDLYFDLFGYEMREV